MFKMKDVGRKIAGRRRELNMTQMELADIMGVSFQAVSNWERGNSMPDIAKLPDLSEWLGISIDELLTDEAPAKLVQHIIEGDGEQYIREDAVPLDTVADVAPILKPQQTETYATAALDAQEAPVGAEDLASVAPFVSGDFLSSWLDKIPAIGEIRSIVPLAPFLPKEDLDKLADKVTAEGVSLRALIPLAPFFSKETLSRLADKAVQDMNIRDLTSLAPFLKKKTLDGIVATLSEKEDFDIRSLTSLAPFLSKETLDTVAKKALFGANPKDVVRLAPFLSKETLKTCAAALMESGDLKMIARLAPFL